jgi:hypothetical protein
MPLGSSSANILSPIGPFRTFQACSRDFQMKGSSVTEKVGSMAATMPEPAITMSRVPSRTWETISSSPPSWLFGKICTSISPLESFSATSFNFDDPCPAIACRVVTCPIRSVVLVCAMAVALAVIVIVPTTNATTVLILITGPLGHWRSKSRSCLRRHSMQ